MHFLPDVYVTCEVCRGKRYNEATLRVKWKDRSIADVLETVGRRRARAVRAPPRAARHPADARRRRPRLHRARPVGDDAVGRRGAAHQAVARARQARHRPHASTCSTSRPPACTSRTCASCSRCSAAWSTPATPCWSSSTTSTSSRRADYVIDLGPEGGARGGEVVAAGTPEEVARVAGSYTGQFLAPLLGIRRARATTAA